VLTMMLGNIAVPKTLQGKSAWTFRWRERLRACSAAVRSYLAANKLGSPPAVFKSPAGCLVSKCEW
jgi:hypothetical protein